MLVKPVLSILLSLALTAEGQQKGAVCPGANRVKVSAPGRLKVLSENRQDVSYSFSGAMQGVTLKAAQQDDWCVIIVSATNGSNSDTYPLTELQVTLPRRITLSKLESRGGSITVRYLNGNVVAAATAGGIDMDEIGGDVNARTGGGLMNFGSIRGSLRALSGGGSIKAAKIGKEAVLETAGGEIVVGEAGGWLRLSTAGNIHVGKGGNAVYAYTSEGLIDVESAAGMVTAETGGGSIQIGSAHGVRCESASGGIRLKNVSGGVRAATASGNLFVELADSQPLEGSFLASGRGDVTVSLPSNLPVTVKALNETTGFVGKVLSDFSEIRLLPAEAGVRRPVVAQGSLNGGGPVLMLSASSGTISIKRRK